MTKLVLASASPRRRELLGRAGIAFDVLAADVDETIREGEAPRAYAGRVAGAKSAAGRRARPDAWVLAADTIVVVGEAILGKPDGPADAARMLARLGGRRHLVMTATSLVGPDGEETRRLVETEVDFRPLDAVEIDSYVAGGEWQGKAGAYAAQGRAAAFITAIHGSYTNVVGLPLAETLTDLVRLGVAAPKFA